MRNRERIARLKRIEPLPLPSSMEAAFLAVEKMPSYADSETPPRTETRAGRSTLAHNARSNV
jgi:hypothetical protein